MNNKQNTRLYSFKNEIAELNQLSEIIDNLSNEWRIDDSTAMNINLVLEEILSNIIFYAYKDDKKHNIDIRFTFLDDKLIIIIEDDGIPFDPTKKISEENMNKTIEEREIGGLGIHFIKSFTDGFTYSRESEKNILEIKKKVK